MVSRSRPEKVAKMVRAQRKGIVKDPCAIQVLELAISHAETGFQLENNRDNVWTLLFPLTSDCPLSAFDPGSDDALKTTKEYTQIAAQTYQSPNSCCAPSPLGQSHFVPQPTGHEHALSRDEEKVFGANVKKDLNVPKTIDAVKGINNSVPTSPTTRAVGAGSEVQVA